MTNNDYSRFSDLWVMMSSLNGNGAEPSENQIKAAFMFCSAYEFELVEKTFANMVENSISVTIGNILSCLLRNGMTKSSSRLTLSLHIDTSQDTSTGIQMWFLPTVLLLLLSTLSLKATLITAKVPRLMMTDFVKHSLTSIQAMT